MFPDLRLLISATVATFFLAATAGLYASLRITHDQIPARVDVREDAPVMRIANSWPTPEPSRAAALRDLTRIATYPPIVAREEIVTDRSDVAHDPEKASPGLDPGWKPVFGQDHAQRDVLQDATQSTMPLSTESHSHAALNETPARDVTGSTGIATQPEPGSVNQTDRPDVHGNIGEAATIENTKARAAKDVPAAKKKVPQVTVTKKVRVTQRRRKAVPPDPRPADQRIIGYPLYLTVPVFN
jgi:hypothetical protein